MKRELFLQSLICLLAVSCSVREIDINDAESNDGDVFYASLEAYSDSDTRVYVDEHIKILWDADDRISIFNENTMNQQYRFTGDTGDNSGFFKKVPNDDFATGNDMDFICAVYPYLEATSIDNSGVLTLTLPEVQSYREDSFGPGANTMVSSTEDNLLKFKNVGGYLVLKFYGEDVSVSSITLEGHNGEKLSGTATVKPAVGVIPNITMASTAGTSITLTCDNPVELGTTRDDATIFWMVVPPTAFTDGFTLTVTAPDGRVYVKETNADLSIVRNGVLRIAPIEVELSEPVQPNNVIYYTSTDGKVVTPYYADVFGASIVSNEYTDGRGVITFNNEVNRIGNTAFYNCTTLLSISLPNSITAIGNYSFTSCRALSSIDIPAFVTSIGNYAFNGSSNLTSITIPDSVISIGDSAFSGCESLVEFSGKYSADNGRCLIIGDSMIAVAPYGLTSYTIPSGVKTLRYAFCKCYNLLSVTIPEGVTTIDSGAFQLCSSLTSITIPSSVKTIGYDAFSGSGLVSITIPSTLESIGDQAFDTCRSLKTVIIEEGVSRIGFHSFYNCTNLISITINAKNPPRIDVSGSASAFDNTSCPIYVPSNSVNTYQTAQYWNTYADRIKSIYQTITISTPTPEAIDLGLSVRWASFNLGASRPQEYGGYFAWGETEPKNAYGNSTYKWSMASYNQLTKYCTNRSYGYNGFTDGMSELSPEDDAVRTHLGGDWRMPTKTEMSELINQCTWSSTVLNGVNGWRVTGPNGNTIFLPAAGGWSDSGSCDDPGIFGHYWSSNMDTSLQTHAYSFRLYSNDVSISSGDSPRSLGYSIRPVSD